MAMLEEDKALIGKKMNNRTYKTPFQLEALEKLYTEHKYPREWMKIEVAANTGLTEKQVSIWLCHRRNKDKNVLIDESCENGRLDRSSGVIQDHGQDSCDSTKPGDHRYVVDPKDGTSSDSSSSLQDVFISRGAIPFGVKSSIFLTQDEANISQKGSHYTTSLRPSGYLKMRDNIEHAAISDVKRQLGKHFCQDGPVLGTEFESIPPGAFEIPQRKLDNEQLYSVTDPIMPHLSQFPDTRRQFVAGLACDVNRSKIISQKSCTENEYFTTLQRRISQINYPHHQATYKSSRSNYFSNPSSDRSSSLLTSEDFARNPPCYANRRMGNMKLHSPLFYEKNTKEHRDDYDDIKSMIVKREESLRSKPSTPLLRNYESLNDEESSRKVLKDENHNGGRSRSREYRKPTRKNRTQVLI